MTDNAENVPDLRSQPSASEDPGKSTRVVGRETSAAVGMRQIGLFGAEENADGDRDSWGTPSDLFRILDLAFGFTLDVCALPWSAKCEKFYTPEIDGLRQDWIADAAGGAAWCNPPFSDIAPWFLRAAALAETGLTTVGICPANRVEQSWWQSLVAACRGCGKRHFDHVTGLACASFAPVAEVVPIPGRVNYVPPPGIAASGAEFPSCLVIYRGRK